MKNIKAVGIDLGTTYSSLAIVNVQGNPEIIPNSEGERLTSSAVFFDEDVILVGEVAKESSVIQPSEVVMFSKRQMGNPNWFFKYKNQRLSPVDISALILKKLKNDAEEYLGYSLPYAVITVPAYFDDSRRRATLSAGEIAGFEVLKLINEPTAAAIAFGMDKGENDNTILIYDLGGGTFDVTLLRMEKKGRDIRIIASDGDHKLGGKDFDDIIIRLCVDRFFNENDFDPTDDLAEMQQLRIDAEKAKKELSFRSKTTLLVRSKGRRSQITITREEFEEDIEPKIGVTGTTTALIRSVLRNAKVKREEVDKVLMVGGSSRIPKVREVIKEVLGIDPDVTINPDEAVSLGAALVAALEINKIKPETVDPIVQEKIGSLTINDVISHSIGIEAYKPGSNEKINSILIKKNSPLPFEVSKEFLTQKYGQTGVKIIVYQGEFQNLNLCNPIGEFTLKGLPPNREPGKKVRVTLICSTNGIIDVIARDIETGKETQTTVDYQYGSSQKQISAKKLWLQTEDVN
jgi:molecular chaperone DnaK